MSRLFRNTLIFGIALLLPIVPFVVAGELPGERWLSAADANALWFAATAGGLLSADVLLPIPSSVVITMSGARLGLVAGALVAWSGLTLGNLLGYALGRMWPSRFAPTFAGQPTALALLVSRPVPILAEAMTLTAGAGRVNLVTVLAACALGNAGYVLVLAAVGAALLPEEGTLIALGIAMCIPLIGWLVWQRIQRARRVPLTGSH